MPRIRFALVGCAVLALSAPAAAQAPDRGAEKRSPMDAYCDRFAGAAREQCLGEARSRGERRQDERRLPGTCDGLPAPTRSRCLEQGGTVAVDAGARPADRPAPRAGAK